jgi:hypothetical protein
MMVGLHQYHRDGVRVVYINPANVSFIAQNTTMNYTHLTLINAAGYEFAVTESVEEAYNKLFA